MASLACLLLFQGMTRGRVRPILVADDIRAETEGGKKRSLLVRGCARALAEKLGAGVNLVYVADLRVRKRRRELDFGELRERLSAAGRAMEAAVDCFLKFGSPAEEILRMAQGKSRPELVVVGTQGRTGFGRILVGSVAEEVIRHCRRPVLVVGPKVTRVPQLFGKKLPKILVPTDLGRSSRAAEQYAASLARRIGAEVTLYHCLWDGFRVVEENVLNSGPAALDLKEIFSEIRRDSIDALKKKCGYFKARGVPCSYKVEERAIVSAQAVHSEAKSGGYALIVSGTHARSVLMKAFFGSTARNTILNATLPVIVVRSR